MYHSLLREVGFISDQDEDHVFVAVVFYILHPSANAAEGFFPGQIEDDKGGSWGSVIWTSDSSELLLASGVPDL